MEGVQMWTKYNGETGGNPTLEGAQEVSVAMTKFAGKGYQPRLRLDNFEVEAFLGSGCFGKVWKAKLKDSGQMVALKQFSSAEVPHEDVWKERDLLVTLKHPRICNIVGAFHDGDVLLVLQLCYGSLADVINRLTKRNKVRFAVQLAQGLEWIHSRNVIHADLNPDNCLVTTSNNLVIADFGSALILKAGNRAVKALRSLGAGGYQDFEANKDFLYSKESDMFSFACVLFEIQTGAYLLHYGEREVDNREYARAFKDGRIRRLQTAEITDDMERQLLKERVQGAGRFAYLLQKLIVDRSRRMTAAEFLASEVLHRLMADERLSMDEIDNVRSPASLTSTYKKFRLHQDNPPCREKRIYDGIYYDEEENPFGGMQSRSLSRYSDPEIVEAVQELNLIPKLVGALAGLDAGNRTEVLNAMETWLQQKHGSRSGQDAAVANQTPTPTTAAGGNASTVPMAAPPSIQNRKVTVVTSVSSSNKNSSVASVSSANTKAPLPPSPSIGTTQENVVASSSPATDASSFKSGSLIFAALYPKEKFGHRTSFTSAGGKAPNSKAACPFPPGAATRLNAAAPYVPNPPAIDRRQGNLSVGAGIYKRHPSAWIVEKSPGDKQMSLRKGNPNSKSPPPAAPSKKMRKQRQQRHDQDSSSEDDEEEV